MNLLFELDWQQILIPGISITEIVIRGSLMYLVLFTLLRFVLKREAGAVSITDLLVVVLIADAAQNGMAAQESSITGSIILVVTIVVWSYTLDWLGYYFPALQTFVHPPPLPLVKEGRLLWRNMRRELITEDELMTQLRRAGVEALNQVRAAYMEGDGHISVIPYDNLKINQSNSENGAR
jgi:uncharacterized membrane protein YcaP (DUF421 family)